MSSSTTEQGLNIRLFGGENRVFRRIKSIAMYILQMIHTKVDPLGYARSVGVKMGENVHFYGMKPAMFSTEPWLITLGDNVYITADVQFVTHDGGTLILRKEVPDLELTAPISVGSNVYIGIRTIILPGAKIGNRCIIGAGSIVTGEIPDNSVAAGIPARVLKTTDQYLEKAKQNSLHFGHLSAKEKEKQLRLYFGIDTHHDTT